MSDFSTTVASRRRCPSRANGFCYRGGSLGESTNRRLAEPKTLAENVTVFYVSPARSEEHTSELQSLMRISYAVFCLKKKTLLHRAQPATRPPRRSYARKT